MGSPNVPLKFKKSFLGGRLGIFVFRKGKFRWKSFSPDQLRGYIFASPGSTEIDLYQIDEKGNVIANYSESTGPSIKSYAFKPVAEDDYRLQCVTGPSEITKEINFQFQEKWWSADYTGYTLQELGILDEPLTAPPELEIDDPDNILGLCENEKQITP